MTISLNNTGPADSAKNITWKARILTLYPEMFPGMLSHSISGRALKNQLWALESVDIRNFASDKHGSVDDQPFGGGPGMVMRADVLTKAIDHVHSKVSTEPLIYLSPRGKLLTQKRVQEFAHGTGITIVCGRFEGIDERVLTSRKIEEISIGDYILSGGEPAAQIILDACVRLLPGVVGKNKSLVEESFENGLLEYPQFTRPRQFEGQEVPEVLLSGDHERIKHWRNRRSELITRERRTDLWAKYHVTARSES